MASACYTRPAGRGTRRRHLGRRKSPGDASTRESCVTKARKPKRFEYFWVRKWWSPETAELIQSWGDTLAAIADEVARRGKPRLRIVRRQVAALEELKRSSRELGHCQCR